MFEQPLWDAQLGQSGSGPCVLILLLSHQSVQ